LFLIFSASSTLYILVRKGLTGFSIPSIHCPNLFYNDVFLSAVPCGEEGLTGGQDDDRLVLLLLLQSSQVEQV
jgi:hypothetical protein